MICDIAADPSEEVVPLPSDLGRLVGSFVEG
jgi:hypothetical protein